MSIPDRDPVPNMLCDVFLARCDPCDLVAKRAMGIGVGMASRNNDWAITLAKNNLGAASTW